MNYRSLYSGNFRSNLLSRIFHLRFLFVEKIICKLNINIEKTLRERQSISSRDVFDINPSLSKNLSIRGSSINLKYFLHAVYNIARIIHLPYKCIFWSYEFSFSIVNTWKSKLISLRSLIKSYLFKCNYFHVILTSMIALKVSYKSRYIMHYIYTFEANSKCEYRICEITHVYKTKKFIQISFYKSFPL